MKKDFMVVLLAMFVVAGGIGISNAMDSIAEWVKEQQVKPTEKSSGVTMHSITDVVTGCEYIVLTLHNSSLAVTPRLNQDGYQICTFAEEELTDAYLQSNFINFTM